MQRVLSEYMIKSPFVIEQDRTPREAIEFMSECGIRHLPVVNDAKLVGIVSDRDLREALALDKSKDLTIQDIMKTKVFAVPRLAPLSEVLEKMLLHKLGSVVVTNHEQEVVGIFTTTDAVQLLLDLLAQDGEDVVLDDDSFESWTDLPDDNSAWS